MRAARKIGWAAVILAVAFAARAQNRRRAPRTILAAAPAVAPGELVGEICDPSSGDRWILRRDPSHPGGPGRLTLVERGNHTLAANPGSRPLIRAGDRLIVEENTPVVTARLEAVALTNAWKGSALKARLTIGGKVVETVADGPGHAVLATDNEARP